MDKKYEDLNLTDEEIVDIKTMRDHFWKEDTATRQQLLQKWRRLKFFWNNITNVWYDAVAHDWRIWNAENLDGIGDTDQQYYDQRINIFRAYLESIMAALSVTIPPVKAFPDDAENSSDLETAKAADKIAQLIFRHNNAPLFWLHSLYTYSLEGLVCAYNYPRFKEEYGTYNVKEYKQVPEIRQVTSCPLCQFEINDIPIDPNNPQPNPEEQTETVDNPQEEQLDPNMMGMGMGMEICPNCQQPMQPKTDIIHEVKLKLVNDVDEPKGRVCIESYGGLNVKIPLYARKQSEVLYLFYCYETHYANAIEEFPDLHDEIGKNSGNHKTGAFDSYEQWARLSTEYRGEYPVNCVTIKHAWFKCAAYNILSEERAKHWKKKYPNGVRASFVNDLFACAKQETLDECWTLMYNPLSDYLSNEPIGMFLTSVQEITNDLISLTKQTVEHGVGLTFVDPAVVDLNAYQQTEVVPGALIPTKPISGNKKIGDGFFEIKTATLSGEVMPFGQQIQSLGQLASGALPSLFGGSLEGSDTASEYSMSKNQAQSRLSITWKFLCSWWKDVMGNAIPMYISIIQTDEKDVQKRDDGSFVNVVIKKSELSGTIGRIELEANENLPISWSQRKDTIMQLLQSPNPNIIQMLMQPENLPILREAIGLDGFFIPGADDVDKQWAEIQQLLDTEPIQTGDPMNPAQPSVEVDVLMDTHPIQFEICRKWAVSEVGQFYKYNHPEKYQNVLLHANQHLMAQNVGAPPVGPDGMPQQPGNPEQAGQPNQENPKLNNKDAPITGDVDVPIAQ